MAINPALGSTFYDAEHIVFLMQENRSFDHQLGTLQGVRGYNDPRAIDLPDKNKGWLQSNKEGDTFAPFHLYTSANFDRLSQTEKELNNKAFATNTKDLFYHELTSLKYKDGERERELNVPKGDVFFQFREDVKNDTLPTVSWLMPPAHFSDHPGEPWFGPWYVSEAMEILLQNPAVWKKTIFIITYDENDGYFDHVPPYIVPNPYKENTGKVSQGIDPKLDFATRDQQTNPSTMESSIREASIGLGYRVPMIVASPSTRAVSSTQSYLIIPPLCNFSKTSWRRSSISELKKGILLSGGARSVGI